ncbi:hypothetical protein [Salinisphaera hydrothermalis]|uniref:Uncharacterized protein n=1 Tax=Salinisphaera hydrothermalis (strain C41B8) TaxID=1304275 RepID=A0A084IQX9_SALHC|nr:hypothetical protein [Salinisphaera hydrothermalis]KEZ79113.1 hypothetical protein C41B8_00150 [Salinisphaera hydrothermalis C41B8]
MELSYIEEKIRVPREQVSAGIEFPEPAMKLDMAARGGDKLRQFKYLHQMCTLHSENFATATQIKVVAVVDGYLENARFESSLGMYLFTRSLLELAAFLHDVDARLSAVVSEPEDKWRPKGEQFFGIIMRARFGTSNKEIAKHLKDAGASKKHLEPFNIMQSLAKLVASSEANALAGKYDLLCDYVHHNLSSHYTSSPGFRVGDSAHSQGGGALLMMKGAPITRYEYPVPAKAKKAQSETLEIIDAALNICISAVNRLPRTPFSEDQLEKMTGSRIGLTQLPPGMYVPTRQ